MGYTFKIADLVSFAFKVYEDGKRKIYDGEIYEVSESSESSSLSSASSESSYSSASSISSASSESSYSSLSSLSSDSTASSASSLSSASSESSPSTESSTSTGSSLSSPSSDSSQESTEDIRSGGIESAFKRWLLNSSILESLPIDIAFGDSISYPHLPAILIASDIRQYQAGEENGISQGTISVVLISAVASGLVNHNPLAHELRAILTDSNLKQQLNAMNTYAVVSYIGSPSVERRTVRNIRVEEFKMPVLFAGYS